MVRVGIYHDKEIAYEIEDYLKIRNCWYSLQCFESSKAMLYYLERESLDLLFLKEESEEDELTFSIVGSHYPDIKLVRILGGVLGEKLKDYLSYILDQYLFREYYIRHDRLLVNCKGRQVLLEVRDLLYVERDKRVSTLVNTRGEEIISSLDLSVLQEIIGWDEFIRCHNSYLVNMNYIREFRRNEFLLKGDLKIPISRRYLEEVRRRLNQWAVTIC